MSPHRFVVQLRAREGCIVLEDERVEGGWVARDVADALEVALEMACCLAAERDYAVRIVDTRDGSVVADGAAACVLRRSAAHRQRPAHGPATTQRAAPGVP
jgi:hypothetical protein